jgi:type IV fimbrial biogenesis protein FimT
VADRGFTVVEMLVVMLILGLLLGVAAPNLRDFLARNAAAGSAQSFAQALDIARLEAIKRNASITVCRTHPSQPGVCLETGAGWGGGWMVFADGDANGQVNGEEQAILVHTNNNGSMVTEEDPAAAKFFVFRPMGAVEGLSGGTLKVTFRHLTVPAHSRSVCIGSLGMVQLVDGGSACS